MTDAPRAFPAWLPPLFLAILSIGLYAPTLNYGLVYDDSFLIADNTSVTPARKDLSVAFELFGREYWEGVQANQQAALQPRGQALYRPLTLFLWALIVNVNGLSSTWPFHLLSILVNAGVVVLLYFAVLRLFQRPRLAFVASLLFALHPLHSEAAAYVAGLSDLLAAATVLGGLLLWERATRDPDHLATKPWVGLLAVLFFGLLAKEQAVLLIPVVALSDVVRSMRGQRSSTSARLAVYWGLLLVLAAHLALRTWAIGSLVPDPHSIPRIDNPLILEPFGVRLLTGFKLLAMQVWLLLWPKALSIDYSFDVVPVARSLGEPAALAGATLVLALLVFGIARLRRWPAMAWGVLVFLGCAVYTSNILVPIGTFFGERLLYLPSAGACVAVAALIEPLLRSRRAAAPAADAGQPAPAAAAPPASAPGLAPVGLVVVLVLAGALGARTIERNQDFESMDKLFTAAEEVVPDSARVQYQLGVVHAGQKLFTKAEEHFVRALLIYDQFVQAAIGLGDVYAADRNWDKAINVYNEILTNLAPAQKSTPEQFDAISNLVLRNRAHAKAAKGDVAGSKADYEQAMRVASDDPSAHIELAQTLVARDQNAEAIPILRSALQLAPHNVTALYLLAKAANAVKDSQAYDEAVAGLQQTENGKTMGLVLSAEKLYDEADKERDAAKKQQALDMFEQARKQSQDTLAVPYIYRARYLAENGRFADAILDLDRALEKSPRHPIALLLKGVALNANNRPAEALPVLQDLLTVNPNTTCWVALADTHARLGMTDDLAEDFQKIKELGGDPAELVEDRAAQLEAEGHYDEAIAAVEQARTLPDYTSNPMLLRRLGIVLTKSGRYDEALSTFDQQAQAESGLPPDQQDAFLPINRFRALLPLGRYDEAAKQLEAFSAGAQPGTYQWPSLLHRRAELFLARKDGTTNPFYNPAEAVRLTDEGIEVTQQQYAAMYDVSIEALVASGRLADAQARAADAQGRFPGERHFQTAAVALKRAADGASADERKAAVEQLRKQNDPALVRIAEKLEALPG